jgi:transposase
VKGAEKGGVSVDPHGYDAGKKIKGKKRHVLVDTQGLLLHAIPAFGHAGVRQQNAWIVRAADIQDRDGGVLLMSTLFGLFPFLLKLYADSGYQAPQFQRGLKRVCEQINVGIVKRSDTGKFVVLPKRWIAERTIAWLNRCRRLAKDWECLKRNGLAFLRWASVRLMVRKLCQNSK